MPSEHDERHPLRAGRAACLHWVATEARVAPSSRVLVLGAASGDLTRLLPASPPSVEADGDLPAFFDRDGRRFDRILSAYALHRLPDDEKAILIARIFARLDPGGRAVFGDLMFEDARARAEKLEVWREAGEDELVAAAGSGFFWDLRQAERLFERLGFAVETKRFSELSWGVVAVRPTVA